MMEGPRHQHLHQEWQEPLEKQGAGVLLFYCLGSPVQSVKRKGTIDYYRSDLNILVWNTVAR